MHSKKTRGKSAPWLPLAIITSTLLLLTGCDDAQQQQQQQMQMPPPGVSVITVTDQQVGNYQEFVARTEAVDTVELRARVEGFLVKREFAEGQQVEKNQLLFEIDPKPYEVSVKKSEADLTSSKAELTRTRRDLARGKDLFEKGHLSQSDYDAQISDEARAEAAVQAAEAGLEAALLNLSYTNIRAPFKGRVGKARYSLGSLVGASSEPLATLTSIDPIYVNFQVDEKQLINYLQAKTHRSGDTANIQWKLRLPNGQEYDREGRFNFADTVVDKTTGTLTLRVEFINPDGILFPGLYVTLISESTGKQILPVIPQASVQENQSGHFVLVVNAENQAEVRQITTGRRIDAMWAIQDGLKTGEKVIVEGLQKVRAGAKVTPSVVTVDPQTGTVNSPDQGKGN